MHAEAAHDPRGCARDIRAAGALAGLSIKPGTPLEDWVEVLRDFDTLLVMSVEPGFGGQSFMPEVLDKVRTRAAPGRHRAPRPSSSRSTAGSAPTPIEQAAEAGVDCFVAGSAVYGADDPDRAVAALRAQAAAASDHLAGVRAESPRWCCRVTTS